MFAAPQVRPQKESQLWSPAELKPGASRANSNVVRVHLGVLDCDNYPARLGALAPLTFDAAAARLGKLGWSAWLHTSHSHTPEHHKFRIAVELAAPVAAAMWWQAFSQLHEIFPEADSSCRDRSRAFFWPGHRPGAEYRHERIEGNPFRPKLDPDAVEPEVAGAVEVGEVVELSDLAELRRYGISADTLRRVEHGPAEGDDPSAMRYGVLRDFAKADVPPELALGALLHWPLGVRGSGQQIKLAAARRDVAKVYGEIAAERAALPPLPDASSAKREATPDAGTAEDLADFECDRKGNPYPTQANIRLALQKLGARVRFNAFTSESEVEGVQGYGPQLSDAALRHLWLAVDEQFGFRPGERFFVSVVEEAARRAPYHPVRDYLAGLMWDGTPRIDSWLHAYGHAEDTEYTRTVGALLLVAAVRRIRKPGCKFDEIVVLESPQGFDKSTAVRTLAVRDEWFTDSLSFNDTQKGVLELLLGKWIAELPELAGHKKSDVEALKAFASRQSDRARLAYERKAVDWARQCVMIGSTNEEGYLRDHTGNRRLWPVRIPQRFDTAALLRDRDQLWAEAARREASGASIRMPRHLWSVAAEQQEERFTDDPWTDVLRNILGDTVGWVSTADLLRRAIDVPVERQTSDQARRIAAVMKRLGWDAARRRQGAGTQSRGFARGSFQQRLIELRVELDGSLAPAPSPVAAARKKPKY